MRSSKHRALKVKRIGAADGGAGAAAVAAAKKAPTQRPGTAMRSALIDRTTSSILLNGLLTSPTLTTVHPIASALVNEPLADTPALALPSEPVHEVVAVSNITAVRVPPMVTAPAMIALPVVQQAPLPIDELEPVLQSAGLMLVQTAPGRHAETQAKMAAEPRPPRVRRERPLLPPMDDAPLVQVETHGPSHERASV